MKGIERFKNSGECTTIKEIYKQRQCIGFLGFVFFLLTFFEMFMNEIYLTVIFAMMSIVSFNKMSYYDIKNTILLDRKYTKEERKIK